MSDVIMQSNVSDELANDIVWGADRDWKGDQ